MKFLCEQCKAKYQIADDKVVGKTVRMKCRKCGHLIELHQEITESSVSADRPSAPLVGPSGASAPRPAARPQPPRPNALAASLTSARPLGARPDRPTGALTGAFKANVQREDEASAPFDMSELPPGNDWYVAINGVPVGPVRVAEIRRKATLGAVTEESLVWQEGLDEWRPLKSFPELAAIIGATAGGRISMTPAPAEARFSAPPPAHRLSSRPSPALVKAPAPRTGTYPAAAPPPRSNVVPLSSRLATAEKLPEPVKTDAADATSLVTAQVGTTGATSLVAAAVLPAPAPIPGPTPLPSMPAPRARRSIPWIPIAMVVMAGAFGVTLAIQHAATPPAPVVVQMPAMPSPVQSAQAPAPVPVASDVPAASAAAPSTNAKIATGAGGSAKASPAAAGTGRSLDLHGLGTTVALADDPGSEGPKATGQCLSEGQVQRVVQLHQVSVRRTCWERSGATKASVNINVMLTVAGDGSAQSVGATGDDPTVARCIENDVRSWHFPAMGCTQRTAIPFKFLLQ